MRKIEGNNAYYMKYWLRLLWYSQSLNHKEVTPTPAVHEIAILKI